MRVALLAGIGLMCAATTANAATVATCGPSKGKAYYIEGDLVSKADSGWTDDGLSGGQTTLVTLANGGVDVIFKDATGVARSARDEGGSVTRHRATAREIAVLVVYPQSAIEIYTFRLKEGNSAELTLVQSKGAPVAKAGIYISQCVMSGS